MYYSGTPLNGHPSTADTHDIMDNQANGHAYLSCTTASLSSHFQKLEDVLCLQLIPSNTGSPAPDNQLIALPAKEGDLGIVNPASSCDLEYSPSRAISEPLTKAILQGTSTLTLAWLTN